MLRSEYTEDLDVLLLLLLLLLLLDSIEVDTKAEESTRETKEKLDGRNKEGHE